MRSGEALITMPSAIHSALTNIIDAISLVNVLPLCECY